MIGFNVYSLIIVITAEVMVNPRSGVLADQQCLVGDFESQARCLLHSQMLTTSEIANISRVILTDLRNTLSKRWQGFELSLFGSLSIGLGMKTSDADYNIQFPNVSTSTALNFLPEMEQMLKEEPSLYSEVTHLYEKNTFALHWFVHIPSQQHVDVYYEVGNLCLYDTKIVKYYLNLDKRFLRLGGLLKLCFKTHGLIHKFGIPNHAVYMLTIFYLQQKKMVPPIYTLQRDSESIIFDKWDVGFNKAPYVKTNTEDLYQLIGGFFKYYSKFNFEEYMVSPFAGRPLLRTAFMDINNFPEEFTLYKNSKDKLQHLIKDYLNCTDICIQNAFEHSQIVGEISHEDSMKFKSFIKYAARMYEELPSDKFFRAIFTKGQFNETNINN